MPANTALICFANDNVGYGHFAPVGGVCSILHNGLILLKNSCWFEDLWLIQFPYKSALAKITFSGFSPPGSIVKTPLVLQIKTVSAVFFNSIISSDPSALTKPFATQSVEHSFCNQRLHSFASKRTLVHLAANGSNEPSLPNAVPRHLVIAEDLACCERSEAAGEWER